MRITAHHTRLTLGVILVTIVALVTAACGGGTANGPSPSSSGKPLPTLAPPSPGGPGAVVSQPAAEPIQLPAAAPRTAGLAQTADAPTAITISPVEDFNPIKTHHTLTASLSTSNGSVARDAQVDFILNRFGAAVGDIISVQGDKRDNTYGIARTDGSGQASVTITSTRPGDTDITASAPAIADPNVRNAFAVKHWLDLDVRYPTGAQNIIGTDRVMTVELFRVSSDAPVADVPIRWTITDDDPDAMIVRGGASANTHMNNTDAAGRASITLRQANPLRGDNTVGIEIFGDTEGFPGQVIYKGSARNEWLTPLLRITKQGPDRIGLLDQATYNITVSNVGDSPASAVIVTDTVPAGMSFVSAEPTAAVANGTVTWNLGTLPFNTPMTFTLVLRGDAVGEWTNMVEVVSAEGLRAQASALTTIVPGTIAVTKTGPEQAEIGSQATYEISVANIGQGGLTGVVLTDTVPTGMSYVSSDPSGSQADNFVTWNIGTLAVNDSRTFSLTLRADEAGSWTDTAEAISAEGAADSAQVATLVVAPSLAVSKTGPSTALIDTPFDYTITVTNPGAGQATNVTLTDTLSSGLTFVSADPAATVADNVVAWNLGTLEAGGSVSITLMVSADGDGDQVSPVDVTSAEGSMASDTATTRILVPSVSVTKTGPSRIFLGSTREYTLTVTNTGTATLNDVVITDEIPNGLSHSSSTPPGVVANGTVTWEIGALSPEAAVTVRMVLRGILAGAWMNTGQVASSEGAAAAATLDINVLGVPGVTVTVTDDPDPVQVGQQTTYIISMQNQSSESAVTGFQLNFTIPDEMSFVSASGDSAYTVTSQVVQFVEVDTVAPLDTLEYRVVVRADRTGSALGSVSYVFNEFSLAVTAEEPTIVFDPET